MYGTGIYKMQQSQKLTILLTSNHTLILLYKLREFIFLVFHKGVFRGGAIGPWPPLWVARIAKLHSKVSKIEAWPPPL